MAYFTAIMSTYSFAWLVPQQSKIAIDSSWLLPTFMYGILIHVCIKARGLGGILNKNSFFSTSLTKFHSKLPSILKTIKQFDQ